MTLDSDINSESFINSATNLLLLDVVKRMSQSAMQAHKITTADNRRIARFCDEMIAEDVHYILDVMDYFEGVKTK